MKIFFDTNIIISAMLYPNGITSKAYYKCLAEHECYISDKTLYELREVFDRKFNDKIEFLEAFIKISLLQWHKVSDSEIYDPIEATIRDIKDRQIYRTAKYVGCDAILTGDNDFKDNNELDIKILVPSDICID